MQNKPEPSPEPSYGLFWLSTCLICISSVLLLLANLDGTLKYATDGEVLVVLAFQSVAIVVGIAFSWWYFVSSRYQQ